MQKIQKIGEENVMTDEKNEQMIINSDQLQKNQLSLNKQIIKEGNQELDDNKVEEGEMGKGRIENIDEGTIVMEKNNKENIHHEKNGFKQPIDQEKQQQSMPKNMKKTSKISTGGCNCLRSKCLKNYCECFTQGKKCNEQCKCISCQNTIQSQNKNKNILEGLQNGERTCSCRKSNCLKKYCECFNNGFKCNKNCKCEDCKNNENYISKEQQMVAIIKQQSKKQRSAEQMQQIHVKLTEILKKTPQDYHSQVLEFISYLLS